MIPKEDGTRRMDEPTPEQVEKLCAANVHLKAQLRELSASLQKALAKLPQSTPEFQEPYLQSVRQKEAEVKSVYRKMELCKKEIESLRRQLEANGSIDKVVALENALREKENILGALKSENRSLLKVKKEQSKALDEDNAVNDDMQSKITEFKRQLRELKEKNFDLKKQQQQVDGQIKEKHHQCIRLDEKLKKYTALLKGKSSAKAPKSDTPAELERLERQVNTLTEARRQDERKYKAMLRDSSNQIKVLREKVEAIQAEIAAKEQETRLNKVKLKELRRLLRNREEQRLPSLNADRPPRPRDDPGDE